MSDICKYPDVTYWVKLGYQTRLHEMPYIPRWLCAIAQPVRLLISLTDE
jgi:hypothetical protein